MPIHVEVVSQERKLFEEEQADSILVPGSEGQLGILPNHSPLITTMTFGELIVRKGDAEEVFAIYGGVVEVRPTKVVVLADAAEFAGEINEEEARAARERALNALQNLEEEREDYEVLAQQLRRAELSINVSRKNQNRSSVGIRVIRED